MAAPAVSNGKVTGVAPLTTVSALKSAINTVTEVRNVDGSVMNDSDYATDNVFAVVGGALYPIELKYAYDPIKDNGSALADGTVLYEAAANTIGGNTPSTFSNLTTAGFYGLQQYAKIGYGSGNVPANTALQTVKATKDTRNGKTVYVLENDSNNYAYLRSHFSNTATTTQLNNKIDSWSQDQIITSVEFEADKMGNISIFNNTPVRNSSGLTKGDTTPETWAYTGEFAYIPNSVHFLANGSVKLGGTYINGYSVERRSPIQTTSFTWESGKQYTVSIVQRYRRGYRDGYVDAVYINGVKVFPNANTVDCDGNVCKSGDSYYIKTKDTNNLHGGGLSSIMVGTAPAEADDNFTVYLSGVKYYGPYTSYNGDITKPNISLGNKTNVTVSDADATVTDSVPETVSEFEAKYSSESFKLGVYNANGTKAASNAYLETGMSVKIASADGLQGKTYALTATPLPSVSATPGNQTSGGNKYMTFDATTANVDASDIAECGFAFANVNDLANANNLIIWKPCYINEDGTFGAAIKQAEDASGSAIYAIPYIGINSMTGYFGTAVKSAFE